MGAPALAQTHEAAFGVARSFSGRRWTLNHAGDGAVQALMHAGNISEPLAHILTLRGVTAETLEDALAPTLKRLLPEPFLLKDMEKAVARVKAAIETGETIAVFGDYDVDGSASAAILFDFLSALGRPPRVYIPDRMTEGYGPNAAALLKLKEEGASLVITVDCGSGAAKPLQAARDAGLDVMILDHHAVDVPPPAVAHVNPNQPGDASGFNHLCAAGVTFLFTVALNRALREAGWYQANGIAEPDLRNAVDLVGLATHCDVVPLLDVNRAFIRGGLAKLGARPGLAALSAIAKIAPPFTSHHLGFILGPRINAGGRVGRAGLGVDLLTARDPALAQELAAQLDLHNGERQALEKLILAEAVAEAATQSNAPFILTAGEGWHTGVVGIVAGRLKDRFGKPAFAIGMEGGVGRGSARSVAGIDVGAVVRAAHERGVIESGGGHAMAAGFSLRGDQVDGFSAFLSEAFANSAAALAAASEMFIDALVSPAGATVNLIEEIAKAGPFGPGNQEPLIAIPDARIAFADPVGKDHVRLQLAGADGARVAAIAFRVADQPLGRALLAARGQRIHVAGRLRADEWNGQTRVQLQIEDAAPAGV
ncbi:MAG TPA: single-stranded-DNA-specific exonuclease RecJ [Rhizomicrobium sp.]|jgi:single-stranded-DNA-specific exonuclease